MVKQLDLFAGIGGIKIFKKAVRSQISVLLDSHCENCEIKSSYNKTYGSNTSHLTNYCTDVCPIGGQLLQLGKQLDTGLRPKSACDENPIDENPIIKKEKIAMQEVKKSEPIESSQLTKEIYLEERKTKTNAQIERDWGFKPNYIYQKLKTWGVTETKTTPIKKIVQTDIGAADPVQSIIAKVVGEPRNKPEADALRAEMQNRIAQLETQLGQAEDDKAILLSTIERSAVLENRKNIFEQISVERERQDKLHPAFQEGYRMDVLIEEVGEVAKAKNEGDRVEMRKELIEVAAVCVRWVEAMDCEERSIWEN